MSAFVASPPPSDPAAPLDLVAGDEFYPGISLSQARAELRIPTEVVDDRLRASLRAGTMAARRELVGWKAAQLMLGRLTLAAIPSDMVDGSSTLELLYLRAVKSYAAAELAETHHDITATNQGRERNEERALTADDHRRNAVHAIRDLLGVTRTAVELI